MPSRGTVAALQRHQAEKRNLKVVFGNDSVTEMECNAECLLSCGMLQDSHSGESFFNEPFSQSAALCVPREPRQCQKATSTQPHLQLPMAMIVSAEPVDR